MAAFNFGNLPGIVPQVKKFLAGLFNTSTGHSHDGVDSKLVVPAVTTYSANGAIAISEGVAAITKTSAAAMTIAAPTTAQNGTVLTILGTTAYAHVVTFTGGTFVNGASTAYTTATFAAYAGTTLRVIAYGGKWYQSGISNVTMS